MKKVALPDDELKRCGYCGRESHVDVLRCGECGTVFPPSTSPIPSPSGRPKLPRIRGDLNGFSAVIIFLSYLAGGIFCIICGCAIALILTMRGPGYTPDGFMREMGRLDPVIVSTAPLVSGLGAVLASLILVPKTLRDRSEFGAAWVAGKPTEILIGIGFGFLISALAMLVAVWIGWHPPPHEPSAIARLSSQPGANRWLALIVATIFAPPTEEMVFRGVLFGGFRRSFGVAWATVITTALFLGMHLPALMYYGPMITGLVGQSVGAVWLRLRFRSIGPAIVSHMAYNATIAAGVIELKLRL